MDNEYYILMNIIIASLCNVNLKSVTNNHTLSESSFYVYVGHKHLANRVSVHKNYLQNNFYCQIPYILIFLREIYRYIDI